MAQDCLGSLAERVQGQVWHRNRPLCSGQAEVAGRDGANVDDCLLGMIVQCMRDELCALKGPQGRCTISQILAARVA